MSAFKRFSGGMMDKETMERNWNMTCKLWGGYPLSREDLEEISQDSLVRLLLYADDKYTLENRVYFSAHCAGLDFLRRKFGQKGRKMIFIDYDGDLSELVTIHTNPDWGFELMVAHRIIKKSNLKTRIIFNLYYNEGWNLAEIGRGLRMGRSTIFYYHKLTIDKIRESFRVAPGVFEREGFLG